MKVCVCGLGYVGSVTAVCLAEAGHEVRGVDVSRSKVEMARAGVAPVLENGLGPRFERVVREARLAATTRLHDAVAACDATLVAVGTPSRPNGSLDTAALETVCWEIGRALKRRGTAAERRRPHTVVVRSTVLPGTTRGLLVPLLEDGLGGACGEHGVGVCYNPEFLREGSALADFHAPPFTLIGCDDARHGDAAEALYAGIAAPRERATIEVAEMVKYACNAFHALKITFANEIGSFAARQGVDGGEVMRLLCQDRKLNISPAYLRPGFAFGGSCLPKDLRALLYRARQTDVDLPLLGAILPSNAQQLQRGLRRVAEAGRRRVGMLGLAFKSGTDDLRESPYVELAEALVGKGYEVRIHDDAVQAAHLVGANERYVQSRLPHLACLLSPLEAVLAHAEVLVVCSADPRYAEALRREPRPERPVIDLTGLPPESAPAPPPAAAAGAAVPGGQAVAR